MFVLQAMRICCQDMFFQRSRPSAPAMPSDNGASLYDTFKATFSQTNAVQDRINVVEELVNLKVIGTSDTDFSIKVICLIYEVNFAYISKNVGLILH